MRSAAADLRRPDRGLRFFEGDGGPPPGLAVGGGRLALVEEAAAVRQSLVALLSTRPGERVMRPDYGCDLDALAFAPMGPTTFMLARLVVGRAIERFEPRAQVVAIEARAAAEAPERLELVVEYAVRGRGDADTLRLEVLTRPDEPVPGSGPEPAAGAP